MVGVLNKIIAEDTGVKDKIFDHLFHTLDELNPLFKRYLKRAWYYNAFSFNDSIYRVLKKASVNPRIISDYENILIDEFQDFSALEVEFIKLLEDHGNILIVGDDDQAIYVHKFDLGESLRNLYHSGNYSRFELPYCSRCPKVIVDSVNDIVSSAVHKGYLSGRVDKRFVAFEPGKEAINENYPTLQVCNMASVRAAEVFLNKYISAVLQDELEEYRNRNEIDPLILIISTGTYLNIFQKSLSYFAEHIEPQPNVDHDNTQLCEAYKILMKDERSNIGWRLLLLCDKIKPPREHKRILNSSLDNTPLIDLLPDKYLLKHKTILDLIRRLINATELDINAIEASLEKACGISLKDQIVKCFMYENNDNSPASCNGAYPIQIVTYQGSKGLAADYVFIVGANDGDIPKDSSKIEDHEICKFIVGLTRTKKKCYILPIIYVFNKRFQKSTFLSWISHGHVLNTRPLGVKTVRELFDRSKTSDS